MANQECIELIHREIDGTISDSDRRKLERFLESDPEARTLHGNLSLLHKTLMDTPLVEPPEGIRAGVMDRIRSRPVPARRAASQAGFRDFVDAIMERFRIQPAIPFAVGVVAGALLLIPVMAQLGNQSAINGSDVAGTIIWDGPEPRLETVGEQRFDVGAVKGTISTRRTEGAVVAELVIISGTDPISLEFTFDPWDVAFQGIASLKKPTSYVSADGDLVRVTHSGENLYRLAFTDYPDRTSTINVRIVADRVLWEGSIRTGP